MLRLRVAGVILVVAAAACGSTPAEVTTAASPLAVVQADDTRHAPAPTTTVPPTTTTAPPQTTTTTAPVPPPAPPTTAAPQPPTVAVTAHTGSCGGWDGLVAAYFPAEQVGKACQVMGCETGGTYSPTIHNARSSASGLFQFLDGTWTSTTGLPAPAADHPPEVQIAAAASLWRSSGWSPWSCA